MNRIIHKLRSDRGASITFGLLLFLICAVLSTVIVVASTAAAGRMSTLVENDQRYYTVTSAAQLLEDSLGDETMTIIKDDEYTKTTTYKADGTVDKVEEPETPDATNIYLVEGSSYDLDDITNDSKAYKVYDGSENGDKSFSAPNYSRSTLNTASIAGTISSEANLSAFMAYQYAQLKYESLVETTGAGGLQAADNDGEPPGENGDDNEGDLNANPDGAQPPGNANANSSRDIDLSLNVSDLGSMDVNLKGKLDTKGNLTVTVSSADGKYNLKMKFEADVRPSTDSLSEEIDANSHRDEDKIVERIHRLENTSLNWQLTGVELQR